MRQPHCSSCYGVLKILLRRSSSCKALRVLRRLSHSLQFTSLSFGQLPVSCSPTLFITSSVLFHYVSFTGSPILHLPHGVLALLLWLYKNTHMQMQILYFITLHFTSLRHSFISVGSSPPAAHNLACLAACLGCGFVMVFEANHKCLALNKNTFQTLASHCCCLSPLHGSIFSTVAGARSQFRSFLPPLALGGTPLGYSVDKCATQHRFFFSRRRYYLFIISF